MVNPSAFKTPQPSATGAKRSTASTFRRSANTFPVRPQDRSTGLGSGQGGFRPLGDHFPLVLRDGGPPSA